MDEICENNKNFKGNKIFLEDKGTNGFKLFINDTEIIDITKYEIKHDSESQTLGSMMLELYIDMDKSNIKVVSPDTDISDDKKL